MPEAESELIAGYHTEYSAMKFSLFFIAEYANMVTVSAMTVLLFFGGWDIPFTHWDESGTWLAALATFGAFATKVLFFLFLFMWIRWTLPRFRYDQLMALGWKLLIPVMLGYVMVMATSMVVLDRLLGPDAGFARYGALFALNAVAAYLLFFVLDRGLVIRGVARRPAAPSVEAS